ncbi:tyrosine-type recombinase/integrase, partial [Bacillus cereus group sp. Bce032]|uniref:tyrosine-type recombinase/integrase n=1 Tax=Bacillus cereus group sp. Bce032 TaxID=3445236 RepID=UPI003F1FE83C
MFTNDQIQLLERAFSKEPNYETKNGYTGNKPIETDGNKEISAKKRKIDHLTRKERRELWKLHTEYNDLFVKNSKITRKGVGKKTKKDFKKGLKAEGVWSESAYETYLKRAKTFLKYCFEEHGVRTLKDVKPRMVGEFLKTQIEKENSPKTMDSYLSALKKMMEYGKKERLHNMKKLVNDKHEGMYKGYKKEMYKRGTKNGYSNRQAKTIAKQAGKFSPYHQAMIETLYYSGLRLDELRKIKWSDLDFENNQIYLTRENVTKGGRPRVVPAMPEAMQKLKEIRDLGFHGHDNQRVFGNRFQPQDVRNFVKECARNGHVKYSGVHDFRRTAVRIHTKLFQKEKLTKEQVVDRLLTHVGTDEKLNPLVKVKVMAKNKDGSVKMRKTKSGKMVPVWVYARNPDGSIQTQRRYTREHLMGRRIDFLINSLTAQI